MNTNTSPTNQSGNQNRYILPTILAIGFSIFFLSGAYELVTWQSIAANYASLNDFVEKNLWMSYLIFMLSYVVVVAFSLPIALILTLTGGALLGWSAVILVICGATAGSGIVFIAARSIFADLLRHRAGTFAAKLEAGFSHNSFSYLLALRLIPAVPFWVVNIVPALTSMRLSPFLLATFIGITPGTAVFISVGRGFNHILEARQTPDLTVLTSAPIIIPLVGLGTLSLLSVVVRHFLNIYRGLNQ